MKRTKNRSLTPAFVAGVAVGAGIAFAQASRARKRPEETITQKSIDRALDRALHTARKRNSLRLDSDHRYVIFSDHHKGADNDADDFKPCKNTYLAALDHYYAKGYTLIVMGDAEELWEEQPASVMQVYRDVFESEARFYQGGDRYIRIHGNHDDAWQSLRLIDEYLSPYFPKIRFKVGLVFEFRDENGNVGEVFFVHGHQGTIESDLLAPFSRRFLPLYREFQIRTGMGRTTPAENVCLRAEHDAQLYRWASKQGKLILIAGHTHRPIWSSRTHLEKLLGELHALQERKSKKRVSDHQGDSPADHDEDTLANLDKEISQLKQQVRRRETRYPPCTDTIKTRPCYFNTGCCRFADGDITGIELDAEQIRLVKWGEQNGDIVQTELEAASLKDIFFFL